ncbi:hypothetical protein GLYMA_02G187150v4 [Glycine max]|nr:hypothetical protein GLYMA_02G187150v4 [Glycine max]KAH1061013.1 hypothetical protein GYH30_004484 [Glycine max]
MRVFVLSFLMHQIVFGYDVYFGFRITFKFMGCIPHGVSSSDVTCIQTSSIDKPFFEVGSSDVTCGSKQVVLITILLNMFAMNFLTDHCSCRHICSSTYFYLEIITHILLFICLSIFT